MSWRVVGEGEVIDGFNARTQKWITSLGREVSRPTPRIRPSQKIVMHRGRRA